MKARYIRFVPQSIVSGGGIAMKVDVLGCDIISVSRKLFYSLYVEQHQNYLSPKNRFNIVQWNLSKADTIGAL